MYCSKEICQESSTQFSASIALEEKRQHNFSYDNLWERLTLSQQFSVVSLGQFGYQLKFIRKINHSNVAVLQLENKIATISGDGMIKISSNLKLRS